GLGELVDLAPREAGAAGHADAPDGAATLNRVLEDAELCAGDDVGKVDELQAEAHVRFVAAEAAHALAVAQAWERRRYLEVRPQRSHHARVELLDQVEDVFLRAEAHLEVELGELRLAVGAQVLVAEAARNLEVAL